MEDKLLVQCKGFVTKPKGKSCGMFHEYDSRVVLGFRIYPSVRIVT